jgi:ADP-heptose:LPS heptosyltransferase
VREILALACRGMVFYHAFRPAAEGHISAAYLRDVTGHDAPSNLEPGVAGLDLLDGDLDEARRLASTCGADAGSYILLMPGSGSPTKNWPPENYLQLARELSQFTPVLTVLGPAEDNLQATFSQLATITDPSLGALAGLARMSLGFVGNDSGVSHLAAAAGACGVVIFGPTDPARWRPLGAVTVLRRMPLRDLPCREVAEAIKALQRRAE